MQSIISKKEIKIGEEIKAHSLSEGIYKLIKSEYPSINDESYISLDELNRYRRHYLSSLIAKESGELDVVDKEVMESIRNNSVLSENIEQESAGKLTPGQKLADKIAVFGGSWTFIIVFFTFIAVWMGINIVVLATKPFDPYPFILLNLLLSCLAAIQAPIIMMSQNRKEQKEQIQK